MTKQKLYYYIFCGNKNFIKDKGFDEKVNTTELYLLTVKQGDKLGKIIYKEVQKIVKSHSCKDTTAG